MKKIIITTIICTLCICCDAQWYIHGDMGLRMDKQIIGNEQISTQAKTQKYVPTNFLFNMGASYQHNMLLAEFTGQYDGNIYASLMGGVSIEVSELIQLHLLSGISDEVILQTIPVSLTQHFYNTATVRLQIGDFYTRMSMIGSSINIAAGVRCTLWDN